jgi:hypothetical protein
LGNSHASGGGRQDYRISSKIINELMISRQIIRKVITSGDRDLPPGDSERSPPLLGSPVMLAVVRLW